MGSERIKESIGQNAALMGSIYMLSASLLFTLLNLVVKTLPPEYTVWHIGFYRFFFGLVILFIILGRSANLFAGVNKRLLIIRGLTGSVAFICVITAIRMLPISTAMVLFYSFPAFSAVCSFLIFGERVGKTQIACIALVIAGICILLDFRLGGLFVGQVMAVVGGGFAGLTVTLIHALREKNGSVVIYFYFCIMGSIVTLPKFLMHPIIPSTPIEWVMIGGVVFLSLTAQLLMNQGFFFCRGWEGGVFMSSEVLFTAAIGILMLGDPVDWRFWAGGGLVVGSVVALNRLNSGRT